MKVNFLVEFHLRHSISLFRYGNLELVLALNLPHLGVALQRISLEFGVLGAEVFAGLAVQLDLLFKIEITAAAYLSHSGDARFDC